MRLQSDPVSMVDTSETPGKLEKKLRVLLLCSHPTQYSSPMWRRISQYPQMDTLVAYCSLEGAVPHLDPGFGVEVAWDIPLLDDYSWVRVRNFAPRPSSSGFFGLINPGVWKLIRANRFDAIAVFTGYMCATFWIALAAAKISGIPILYGTDTTTLQPRTGRKWKSRIKRRFWPWLFGMADVVMAPSSGTVTLLRSLNIPEDRIQLTPYVVDNRWWTEKAKVVDRAAVRRAWRVPGDAKVILFCAKLQPWKRPQDLLRAFALANIPNAYLVYAGDGTMREQLEREVNDLHVQERIRFLGFTNQSKLPSVYCSSDLMVLCSEYEAFGLVVNEAMLCGCPVVVSDRVGARFDLVRDNETGFVYPVGDVEALRAVLLHAFESGDELDRMRHAARAKMSEWSPEANMQATVTAFRKARELRIHLAQ